MTGWFALSLHEIRFSFLGESLCVSRWEGGHLFFWRGGRWGLEWSGSGLGMSMLDPPLECCFIQKCLPFILASSISLLAEKHLLYIAKFAFAPPPPPPNICHHKQLQENTRYSKLTSLKASYLILLTPTFNYVRLLYFFWNTSIS